jgi:hypothetical protein
VSQFWGDGMLERCGYRAALYLSALIAVVNWSFFTYVQWYLPRLGDGAAIYAVGAVLVLVGLWLQSKIARYVGAAFYFLLAGVVAFNISGLGKQVSVGLVWAVMAAVLSLAAGSILIFSKSFAREFAAEREKRPPYKNYLLHAFTLLIGLAIAAATSMSSVWRPTSKSPARANGSRERAPNDRLRDIRTARQDPGCRSAHPVYAWHADQPISQVEVG